MKNFILSNTQASIVYIVLVTVCMIIFAFKLAQKVGLERIRAGVYKAFILAEREFKYGDNKNTLQDFKAGVFKCAMDAKVPVIPVALIDSYKAMDGNSLRKVTTQVHYLKPIPYEEYKDMKKTELAELTKSRIQEAINEYAK